MLSAQGYERKKQILEPDGDCHGLKRLRQYKSKYNQRRTDLQFDLTSQMASPTVMDFLEILVILLPARCLPESTRARKRKET